MTKSTVFVNPNLIAQSSIRSLPDVTNVEWKGSCFLFNCFPKLVLQHVHVQDIPAEGPSVPIVCPQRGPVAVKIFLFRKPREELLLGVEEPNPRDANCRRVKLKKLPDGSSRYMEKVKIRSHGSDAFAELLHFVTALGSPEVCGLLHGIVTQMEKREDYTIQPADAFFSQKFDRLVRGNTEMQSPAVRIDRKVRWFTALAWLNWSLACLERVNQHMESALVRGGTPTIQVHCLQGMLGQMVKRNIKRVMEVTLDLLPGGLPCSHPYYASVEKTRRRMGPSR